MTSILQQLQANLDVRLIQGWLAQCIEGAGQHKFCAKSTSVERCLPRRFIDVGVPTEWPCVPKLVDAATLQPSDSEAIRYITLSHSWSTLSDGEQDSMKTTVESLEKRQAGIEIQGLPPQYQATILLCRCLGVRYLWIDSLCIIQGPGGDWSTECVRMAQIYNWAYLTISTNTTQNLLDSLCQTNRAETRQRRPNDAISTAYKNAHRAQPVLWIATFWKMVLEGGPIGDRAWCLQERQLSPKVLHLIDDGNVVFECTGIVASSASEQSTSEFVTDPRHARILSRPYPRVLLPRVVDLIKKDAGMFDCMRFWYSVFSDYQKRQMTYRTDNLIALQGVAELVTRSGEYTYLSGIWLEDLARGLLWARNNAGDKGDANAETRRQAWTRFDNYQGPSWSWCSVKGSTRIFGIEKGLSGMWEVDMKYKQKGADRGNNRYPLISSFKVSPVHSGDGVRPWQEGSYLQVEGLIGRFHYIAGRWDNTGHLKPSSDAPVSYLDCGSIIFDIPSEWRSRDVWCLPIASPPGTSDNPWRPEYLALAMEPLDATHLQIAPGLALQDAGVPSFKRLGLAIMQLHCDFGLGLDEEGKSLHELQQFGFQMVSQIRLF